MKRKGNEPVTAAADPDLRPGQSVALLQELHILTREGRMNQDSRRKLKQVYHLYQFIEPLLRDVVNDKGAVSLVDHGAGKSYLGFILYDLFFKEQVQPIFLKKRVGHARCIACHTARPHSVFSVVVTTST